MAKTVFKSLRKQALAQEVSMRDLMLVLMLFVALASAVGVVYTKHLNRKLFAQLQIEQHQQDVLHIEWSQLLLEQGAFASNARVERLARETLKMQVPESKDMKVLTP